MSASVTVGWAVTKGWRTARPPHTSVTKKALIQVRMPDYFRLETFLLEGTQGNDLMDYTREQIINDILDQYERHMTFLHIHREAPGNTMPFPEA